MWLLVSFVVWVICGIFAGSIAQTKGYSGCLWLIIGFMFGPLAILGIGFMAAKPANPDGDIKSGDRRACPHCAEPIRWEAMKCRHCGGAVPLASPPQSGFQKSMENLGRSVKR